VLNDEDNVSETLQLHCVGVARAVVVPGKCEEDDCSKEGIGMSCTDIVFRIYPISLSISGDHRAEFKNISREDTIVSILGSVKYSWIYIVFT
jgi:hypothetical protein